jgi:Kelch motif protein
MTQALPPGRVAPRRRVLFGLLDADGWAWAGVKATFWFLVILLLLGYLPDRAYYFTVNRTLDLGIVGISPVNFCPPENEQLPCPAPAGAVLPWYPSPEELSLGAPRTDAAAIQVGTNLLLIGGSDGTTPSAEVWVAEFVDSGTYDRWQQGPPLPEPRTDTAVAFLGGSVYVVGGYDQTGAPTDTTFVLTPNAETGELGEWRNAAEDEVPLTLPEARGGASVVALGDGLLVVGGTGPDGVTKTVWKSTLDADGVLGAWTAGAELNQPSTDAIAVQLGDFAWVYGGSDGSAPSSVVQRGVVSGTSAAAGAPAESASESAAPAPSPSPSPGQAVPPTVVERWEVDQNHVTDLPEARANAGGWAANGALYLVGGTDGTRPRSELYWTTPDAQGNFSEWHHLAQSDLPAEGLAGPASLVSGANAFLIGGTTADRVIPSAARANLAPQEPFFQLGLVGMVVPALKIDGEIGQQLGYLNAAGVGTVNLILLLIIGWLVAHPERTRAMVARIRRRGSE